VNRAYLYIGENIPAVTGAAKDFAKTLNCFVEGVSYCGTCLSCTAFDSGNHPDTFYVESTKKSIGANDIREQLITPMAVKPYSHRYKVFIVERAQDLTPQAQNVLLKIIEEPADYGVFLFIAPNIRSFLPTVLSRADIKKFSGDFQPEYSSEITVLADEIFASLVGVDMYGAFMLHRRMEKLEKTELMQLLDLLYVKYGRKITEGAGCFRAAGAITKTKKILLENGNTQLAVELLFCRLREAIV